MQNNKQKPVHSPLSHKIHTNQSLPQILSETDAPGAYALYPGVSNPLTHWWIPGPQSLSPGLKHRQSGKIRGSENTKIPELGSQLVDGRS